MASGEELHCEHKQESLFRTVQVVQHISLPPSYIGRMAKGITEILNRKILKYFSEYGGFVLAYSKPLVLQRAANIVNESPNLHFEVQVDLHLFTPLVGALLCGTVNHVINESHVGCLVYNCFNASVERKPHTKNGITRGEKIWFRVVNLETISGVLCIRGKEAKHGEDKNNADMGNEPSSSKSQIKHDDECDITEDISLSEGDISSKVKKKKRKRKRQRLDEGGSYNDDLPECRFHSKLKKTQSENPMDVKEDIARNLHNVTDELNSTGNSASKHKRKKSKTSQEHDK